MIAATLVLNCPTVPTPVLVVAGYPMSQCPSSTSSTRNWCVVWRLAARVVDGSWEVLCLTSSCDTGNRRGTACARVPRCVVAWPCRYRGRYSNAHEPSLSMLLLALQDDFGANIDDMLHAQILDAITAAPGPGTLVLLTGDGNLNSGAVAGES